MEEYFARICYNTFEWKRPSGSEGKGKLKDSFEKKEGFGHEEWLFDESKIIDGYHYSFLQPIGNFIYAGHTMDVHLFFYSKDFGKLYLGILHNVECLTEKQAINATKIYKKNGWLKEMKADVAAISGNVAKLEENKDSLFNIRFKFKDAEINLSNPRIISQDDPNTKATYYKLYKKKGDIIFSNVPDTKHGVHREMQTKSEKRVVFNTDIRRTSYDPQHNKMQNAIKKILEITGEYKKVALERNYVDITATQKDGKIDFYELKTAAAKASIREAIGQILEYTHYPNNKHADRMIIVGPNEPDKYDKLYLQYLRDTYKLPIWFRAYSFEEDSLSKLF